MDTLTLYRPVGLKELQLIADAGWKAFPPRLDWQPIFYPVLNQPYAAQIARQWNTADEFSGYCGIVTAFEMGSDYLEKYTVQNVGSEMHNELWVPAGELEDFNQHIVNGIHVVAAYFGDRFTMPADSELIAILSKFRM